MMLIVGISVAAKEENARFVVTTDFVVLEEIIKMALMPMEIVLKWPLNQFMQNIMFVQ